MRSNHDILTDYVNKIFDKILTVLVDNNFMVINHNTMKHVELSGICLFNSYRIGGILDTDKRFYICELVIDTEDIVHLTKNKIGDSIGPEDSIKKYNDMVYDDSDKIKKIFVFKEDPSLRYLEDLFSDTYEFAKFYNNIRR